MKLAIVDLGCGNIGSVRLAFGRFGLDPIVTADPEQLAGAERVVLPGVGAAGFAMERIEALGLRQPLRSLKQPALGICLGMQLLFDRSEEENVDCLGIIPGRVRALEPEAELPVPHMGWSRVEVRDSDLGRAIDMATSRTVRSCPEPMLNTSPGASGWTSASQKARATSLMWTKSRLCSPSSKIIGRWPFASREEKMARTPV